MINKFHIFNEEGDRIDPNSEDMIEPRMGRQSITSWERNRNRKSIGSANGHVNSGITHTNSTVDLASSISLNNSIGGTTIDEEELQKKEQLLEKKRHTLKEVFLQLTILEDARVREGQEISDREKIRKAVETNFDTHYKEATDFGIPFSLSLSLSLSLSVCVCVCVFSSRSIMSSLTQFSAVLLLLL